MSGVRVDKRKTGRKEEKGAFKVTAKVIGEQRTAEYAKKIAEWESLQ